MKCHRILEKQLNGLEMTKNKLYIAAAGAGKTTYIINHAVDYMKINDGSNIGIITYTIKNQEKS